MSKPRNTVRRADEVQEMDGGWFGATGHGKDVKRMFRTKEEADACDGLLMGANDPPPNAPKKKGK